MFSLIRALPSPTSAEDCSPLFGWFIGTVARIRLLRDVHARLMAQRLRGPVSILMGPRRPGDLPVLVHIVSQRAWVLRLRRAG
jgi:hypothetical protein